MSKYYTVIDTINDKFVGLVFNESNNEKIYQTQEYSVQSQAINDINNYLQGKNLQTSTTYTNTIQQAVPTPAPRSGRCCGR